MKAIFLALVMTVLPSVVRADRDRGSLEQFNLPDLHLVSVSKPRCDGTRFAYVRDPKGFLHHAEVGEYIGTSEGRISQITLDAIILVELKQTSNGKWVERKAKMSLMQQRGPTDIH